MRRMRPVRGEARHGYVEPTDALEWARMPGPRAVCRWRFIGSSERTEPIARDQSARRDGNSHRTLIAPAIGATVIADCLLPANWPRNCEYGPIFDPLRPDLKERLRSAMPRFLVGPRMQHHSMRY